MKNGLHQSKYNKIWYKDNQVHRISSPAIIRFDSRLWLNDGKFHRLDGPAIMYNSPTVMYCWYIRDINITKKLCEYCKINNINIDDYMNFKFTDKFKLKIKFGLQL